MPRRKYQLTEVDIRQRFPRPFEIRNRKELLETMIDQEIKKHRVKMASMNKELHLINQILTPPSIH